MANPEHAIKYMSSIQVRNRYIGDTHEPDGCAPRAHPPVRAT
jgi:hypothetical protein